MMSLAMATDVCHLQNAVCHSVDSQHYVINLYYY